MDFGMVTFASHVLNLMDFDSADFQRGDISASFSQSGEIW
jgi:hypothetical protein